jgi:hypothetical protein
MRLNNAQPRLIAAEVENPTTPMTASAPVRLITRWPLNEWLDFSLLTLLLFRLLFHFFRQRCGAGLQRPAHLTTSRKVAFSFRYFALDQPHDAAIAISVNQTRA